MTSSAYTRPPVAHAAKARGEGGGGKDAARFFY